ncbi:ATP-binding protein [Actinosynnema sp. NPDC050436]|uniref:ATP-binding protein n=1 Tax=Actinosynnema sp. NPDC050436 TaxID=3155659 RepID=UPI003407ABBD
MTAEADVAPDGEPHVLDLGERPAIGAVRRWTERAVPHLPDDLLADLLLLVTELVGNAYDHGHQPGALRLTRWPGRVRVEVDDSSPAPPVPGRSRIADSRGRGLLIVAALSGDWGTTGRVDGKTVWADLPLHPVPSADAAGSR